MDNNINFYIEQLKKMKREVTSIKEKIESMRKALEETMKPLINVFEQKKNELCTLSERKISVRLGDLIDELAWLSGIKTSDIYVEIGTGISFYGKYNIYEILELMNSVDIKKCRSNDNEMEFDLFGCGEDYSVTLKPIFEYYTLLPLDLDEIQADGTRLIEHCNTRYEYDEDGRVYTKVIINNGIENILCHFNLGCLDKDIDEDWNPADLFMQAIINCVGRKYNSRVDKVRERTKDSK